MKNKFFIPEVIRIDDVEVPSTPFNFDGNPIFLGDVFTVEFEEEVEDKETYLAELVNGQYMATSANPNKDAPLHVLQDLKITVLGSSIRSPELLNFLSN